MHLIKTVMRSQLSRKLLAAPLQIRRNAINSRRQPALDVIKNIEDFVLDDVTITLPHFKGTFKIGVKSHLLHSVLLYGTYEPVLAKLFEKHIDPDFDIIDVGANVGFFTVLSGAILNRGRVLSIEPTTAAFTRLQHNVLYNGIDDKTILFKGLISNHNGEESISIVSGREEYSSIGGVEHPSVAGQASVEEKVYSRTLDSLVEEHGLHPKLIKVDVEGAEGYVFAGSHQTISKFRPVVMSELNSTLLEKNGSSFKEIIDIFKFNNYKIVNLDNPSSPVGADLFGNILAIPL